MDTLERNQVRLILERLKTKHLHLTEDAYRQLEAEHAAKRILRSGATIKRTVRIFEERACLYLEEAINDIADIAQDTDAYALINASLTDLFRGFESFLDKAVGKVSGSADGQSNSVRTAADQLFAEKRGVALKQLQIHQFTFTKPTAGDMARSRERLFSKSGILPSAIPSQMPSVPTSTNAGGKPLAKHWDSMWAAIAVKLWTGDVQPQTQADIKDAMFEWFNQEGINVGDTAVTQRARQLWQAMQDAES